jgi:DNA-binding LacI/PurR family transcriptional regulator
MTSMPRNFVKPHRRMQARDRVEAMIRGRRLWGQRLMSEREMARELGVCRYTLQGALAELEAAGIVERRHGSGTFAAKTPAAAGRRGTVRLAVIVEHRADARLGWDYRGEMVEGIAVHAAKLRASQRVLSLDVPEERELIWDSRRMREFGGFISIAADDRKLICHLLALRRGPVVLVDHHIRDLPIVSVVDGSLEGARAVTRHLLALGHRRIAFLNCWNSDAVNPEKFAGYRAALADREIAFDPELVAAPGEPETVESTAIFAREATKRLLSLSNPPTAIFGFNDMRVLPVLEELEARGRAVGRDFSVAGFGDSAMRRGLCDWLTSCRIYPRKMGQEAVRAALDRGARSEGRTIIVPDRLYVRRSTGPAPGAEQG